MQGLYTFIILKIQDIPGLFSCLFPGVFEIKTKNTIARSWQLSVLNDINYGLFWECWDFSSVFQAFPGVSLKLQDFSRSFQGDKKNPGLSRISRGRTHPDHGNSLSENIFVFGCKKYNSTPVPSTQPSLWKPETGSKSLYSTINNNNYKHIPTYGQI